MKLKKILDHEPIVIVGSLSGDTRNNDDKLTKSEVVHINQKRTGFLTKPIKKDKENIKNIIDGFILNKPYKTEYYARKMIRDPVFNNEYKYTLVDTGEMMYTDIKAKYIKKK